MISIPEREALPSARVAPVVADRDAGDVAEVAGRDARRRRGARGGLRLRGREQHEGGQHGGRGERGDRHAHRPSLADVGIRSVAMEAATSTARLSGEKAQRIVDAMRTCVGERGATGATFDHVARAAGVSRGLLHYYFGTKEKLLAEVVRRDCDLRMERLSATAAGLGSPDDLLDALSGSLVELIEESPEFFAILLELHVVGRHNEEIAAEVAELHRRVRGHLALILTAARDAGAITLADEPEVVVGDAVRAGRRAGAVDARRAGARLRADGGGGDAGRGGVDPARGVAAGRTSGIDGRTGGRGSDHNADRAGSRAGLSALMS